MRILEKPVPIGRIFLDLTNPRHVPFQTEDEAIEYLCASEDVWSLARDIAAIGLNPLERVALIPIRGQKDAYTMAEGNRRLCALKLLADPDRAPARLRKGFATLATQRTAPTSFAAVVFDDDEEVRPWLERMHNGAYEGRGRRAWNAEQSQRYSGSNKNKVAQGFLDYAVGEGLISERDRKGKLTTVQRFVGFEVFREAMGLDQSNPDDLARTRPKGEFDIIATRFIRDLLDTTTEPRPVTSRMNKREVTAYSRPLGSLPGVTSTRIEAEPLSSGDGGGAGKNRGRRKTKPKKPQKAKHVEYADEIASALKSYGNYKLEALYHSICTVELEHHTPLICVGAWSFFETLTACAGRNSATSFLDFASKQRLLGYGVAAGGKHRARATGEPAAVSSRRLAALPLLRLPSRPTFAVSLGGLRPPRQACGKSTADRRRP
jgi:hypothetical protein